MTINDWMDFNFECFPICNCSECIYKYACEQSFHCGAEVVSEIVAKCKTYEEVIRDYIKDQQFLDDLNALLTSDEKNYYYMLGFDEQNNFINVMKTSKGNQRH